MPWGHNACGECSPLIKCGDWSLGVQIQRLQRHATYGMLKQLVLQIIADDVIDVGHGPAHMIDTLRSVSAEPCRNLFGEHISISGRVCKCLQWADQRCTAVCRDLFRKLDTDESGGISPKELGIGLKELGYVVTAVTPCAAILLPPAWTVSHCRYAVMPALPHKLCPRFHSLNILPHHSIRHPFVQSMSGS